MNVSLNINLNIDPIWHKFKSLVPFPAKFY